VRAACAAAALCAALLAGCGGGGASPAKPTPAPVAHASSPHRPGDAEQLDQLMKRRAAALAAGRPRAYAATATGPQRDRDREVARNARGLPLRDVALHVDSADVSGRSATLKVRAIYGVRGVRGTFATTRRLTARRTSAGWRVRSESTLRERHPWELGRVEARRSKHFVVLAPRGLAIDVLTSALEGGYARMGVVLKKPRLRDRYLVVVAGGIEAARSLTESIRGVESLAAISDAEVQETGSAQRVSSVVSQRLVVVWPPFSALDADGQQRVVTHELTHAALAGVTSGRTPAWLIEGIALYVSGDERVSDASRYLAGEAHGRARRALSLRALSKPDAIARLSGDGQAVAYAYSSAASFYLAERFGRRRFLKLYNVFNDEALPGHAGAATTSRAVRRTLGISLATLQRDLDTWLRG
jgi:Peptidase MA superfamily